MTTHSEFTCPTPDALTHLLPGYEVNRLVSTGKRGALYQARQVSLDRTVTIKVLPPEIGRDPVLHQAFETEAKAMARLNDPNLVDVFDFGDIQGMLYIIMEHVPGRSLFETTHGKHVDQKESTRLVADLCHGLDHAHQAGMIHRGLNPKSVLIDNEAQAKIVDFGIAHLTGIDNREEASGYSAPELFRADSQVDARADIYSAGMILYELLVGTLPSNPYTPPSAVRNIRPELDKIIFCAIQPDPTQRYSSAGKMAQELENVLKKMGTPPTQKVIKTMLMTGAPTGAIRRPAVSLPVAKPSNNSALIVTLLTVAILIGIVAIVVKSSSQPTQTNDQSNNKPVATQKPQATPEKLKPTRVVNPDTTRQHKRRERDQANKPSKPKTPQEIIPKPIEDEPTQIADSPPPVTPEPDPPAKPAPPEFDVDEWLLTARTFMQNKAQRTLADYDKALSGNIDSFKRDVKRRIRKLNRGARKPAELAAEKSFQTYKTNGRLPEKAGKGAPKHIKNLYQIALDDQTAIDNKYLMPLTDLRTIYIQGIDKQITILTHQGNDEHARTLKEEISATQQDMARFIRILRNPDLDPEQDEKGSKNAK